MEGRKDGWMDWIGCLDQSAGGGWLNWLKNSWDNLRVFQRLTQQMDPWRGESCRLKVHFIAFFRQWLVRGPLSLRPAVCAWLLLNCCCLLWILRSKRWLAVLFVRNLSSIWRNGGASSSRESSRADNRQQTTTKKKAQVGVERDLFVCRKRRKGWIPTMHSFIHSPAAEWINDTKGGCSTDQSSLVCIFVQ